MNKLNLGLVAQALIQCLQCLTDVTVPQTIFKFMLEGVPISLKMSLPIVLLSLKNSGSHYSNNI